MTKDKVNLSESKKLIYTLFSLISVQYHNKNIVGRFLWDKGFKFNDIQDINLLMINLLKLMND